jgi:phosphate transport system permease protein
MGIAALLIAIAGRLFFQAWPILEKSGSGFFSQNTWDPVNEEFGSLAFIFGTLASSLLALAMSVPVSLAVALFLTEILSRRLASAFSFLVEMLAAIPSVVYGLWGIFVVAPIFREEIQPWVGEHWGWIPLFQGPPLGVGLFTASLVLAIMITPTIASIAREVFLSVPQTQREAALALGSTRWEMMKIAVLRPSFSGIVSAVILGLGRALGETMAVTMVIGNRADISWSLFAPAQTMASVIANEYAEAEGAMHLSALSAVGLALFVVSLIINLIARLRFR